MADSEPLLFKIQLGSLRPMSGAAEEALRTIGNGETVRIEIKRTRGNQKRMSWYWVMLKLALENLEDAFDGPMTTKALHEWLKRKAGLAQPIKSKKTGEIMGWDTESISFATMPENERAAFVDFASNLLASRLGVDVHLLTSEAQRQS